MIDSRIDTLQHIRTVNGYIHRCVAALLRRGQAHDLTKLDSPEREAFDSLPDRLAGVEYGSEAYKAGLASIEPALAHHYAHNSHHPEHYPNGIAGMNLLDVVEMLCDWKAASERQQNGNLAASIRYNQTRFGMSDELTAILLNTVPFFEKRDHSARG